MTEVRRSAGEGGKNDTEVDWQSRYRHATTARHTLSYYLRFIVRVCICNLIARVLAATPGGNLANSPRHIGTINKFSEFKIGLVGSGPGTNSRGTNCRWLSRNIFFFQVHNRNETMPTTRRHFCNIELTCLVMVEDRRLPPVLIVAAMSGSHPKTWLWYGRSETISDPRGLWTGIVCL
jgi:hypothetical protein